MAQLLIIDDDPMIRELLGIRAAKMGHDAVGAETLAEGMTLAAARNFDLVFLDVRLPDGNGLRALPKIRNLPYSPEVIIITGVGDDAGAELAIRSGAWDYLQKPFASKEIILQITRALDFRQEKHTEKKVLSLRRDRIVGNSDAIRACLDQVAQCATSGSNVLVTGETGTGKEIFARTIHENSERADRPFVVVDCAALPDQLVESILFGHEKGAFTGADRSRQGLLKQADGGTLCLDEIGELPVSLQKSLLRALQERRFRPVGSDREVTSDFRLVSATNRNLDEMVETGDFRKDLLYRLRIVEIHLPALRERKEDLASLATHYIQQICKSLNRRSRGFVPEFIEALSAYDWPGNIREMANAMEETVSFASDAPVLYPLHLPAKIRIHYTRTAMARKLNETDPGGAGKPMGINWSPSDPSEPIPPYKTFRESVFGQIESRYLLRLMAVSGGEVSSACRVSGLGKSRLYALLQKHGIPRKA